MGTDGAVLVVEQGNDRVMRWDQGATVGVIVAGCNGIPSWTAEITTGTAIWLYYYYTTTLALPAGPRSRTQACHKRVGLLVLEVSDPHGQEISESQETARMLKTCVA